MSKAIAEDLVYSYRDKFLVAVVRPSIIVSCNKEPSAGYLEGKQVQFNVLVEAVDSDFVHFLVLGCKWSNRIRDDWTESFLVDQKENKNWFDTSGFCCKHHHRGSVQNIHRNS